MIIIILIMKPLFKNLHPYIQKFLSSGIVIFILILSFSFETNPQTKESSDPNKIKTPGIVDNIDWSSSERKTITGKIMRGNENRICIVQNWTSRSRVSYYIYGVNLEIFSAKINKFAQITGWVLKNPKITNRWSRKILVTSILKISDNQKLKGN